ncbi:MAG TPA: XRE family transcriptional regulator [Candidatus Fournierella merdavium]|uniref:XRE family transcriptional regulator n=1 Tax=Allofournierella TaxID=1940255 RepID=UPI001FA2CFDF|nr:XRE family transcriptional regulator [Candidatus Fournierella merdipullorum]HJB20961.1 XRE family transcriptional regulator [Candidatus Fournierella merdavium]
MQKSKLTDFGLCVKTELLRQGMSQAELEKSVSEDTGLFVDSGYMYKILTGQRSPEKIVSSICRILDIPAPTE